MVIMLRAQSGKSARKRYFNLLRNPQEIQTGGAVRKKKWEQWRNRAVPQSIISFPV